MTPVLFIEVKRATIMFKQVRFYFTLKRKKVLIKDQSKIST